MRCSHTLRHCAPHATQRLSRPRFDQTLGSALDVRPRDRTVGSGRFHKVEVDAELVRYRPNHWKDLKDPCWPYLGLPLDPRWAFFLAAELAHHRAGILLRTFRKFDEGSANLDQVTLGAEQVRDTPAKRGLASPTFRG